MSLRYTPWIQMTEIWEAVIEHQRNFTGHIRYVSASGSNDNDGTAHEPFRTITYAISESTPGDAIKVKAGTYDETGLEMALEGLELWCEIGVIIIDTALGGVTFKVSADSCRIIGPSFVQAGQPGLQVTGSYGIFEIVTSVIPTVGFVIDGSSNSFKRCVVGSPTVTGFDIANATNRFNDCWVRGAGGATRGFYFSDAAADGNVCHDCHSVGNATAGFECVAGTKWNSFPSSTSGGGDGAKIDAGDYNDWSSFTDVHDVYPHQHVHPKGLGQGVSVIPITISNTTTDDSPDTRSDQDYWGDILRIINLGAITNDYHSLGLYIFANTTAKIFQWELYFTNPNFVATRDGGNAWLNTETSLTVDDASLFAVDDVIWVNSTGKAEGEIMLITNIVGNIVTVASEARFSGNVGLRYDHGGGDEAMHLLKRSGDPLFETIEGVFSAGSAKDFTPVLWHKERLVHANAAILMRVFNGSDDLDADFDVVAIIEH